MTMRGFRIAVLSIIGLFLWDAVVLDTCCAEPPGAADTCHGCPCGPHLVSPSDAPATVDLRPTPFVSHGPQLTVNILSKAIFHPPKRSV
jgi:hypothetical protein